MDYQQRIAALETAYAELLKLCRTILTQSTPFSLENMESIRGVVWLDSAEVCSRISRHANTLNRWRKNGKIPADCWQRAGFRYNYREAWVHGVIKGGGQ